MTAHWEHTSCEPPPPLLGVDGIRALPWLPAERDPTLIKAPWLLVIEGDYAFIRPVRAPPAESDAPDTGFPFFYINPQAFSSLIRPMYPASAGPLTDIPPRCWCPLAHSSRSLLSSFRFLLSPCSLSSYLLRDLQACLCRSRPRSGPAPILARARDWAQLTPDWERLTLHIENTAQAKERLGWVREMYAFSIAAALQVGLGETSQHAPTSVSRLLLASPRYPLPADVRGATPKPRTVQNALQGISLDLKRTPKNELIAQPPNDQVVGEAAMLHYTWGALWFDNERRSETAKYKDSTDILQQIKFKYGPEVRKKGRSRDTPSEVHSPAHGKRVRATSLECPRAAGTIPGGLPLRAWLVGCRPPHM